MRTFKDLKVWRKGIELVKEVYRISQDFPKEEQYGLLSQMKRSAISIPSNIAEGFRRRFTREQKQFFNIAIGSSAELETQITIAKELGYIDETKEYNLIILINHICGMLVNMCKRL
ncbi:MAG: four helix bundle protein [Omnitrophica WOR_2 bacterium RBG_13_41_10]|nr:MAG: four helix bundle protein [Omnitrophica WOR_2 bacterium RBG_13_41_10]